jgi:hypothetical protein
MTLDGERLRRICEHSAPTLQQFRELDGRQLGAVGAP